MNKKIVVLLICISFIVFISAGIALFIRPYQTENNDDTSQAATYTLTIDTGDGTANKTITQATGTTYDLGIPTRKGYKFQGWVMDSGVGSGSLSTLGTPLAETNDKFFKSGNNGLKPWKTTCVQTRVARPSDLAFSYSNYINKFVIANANIRDGFITRDGNGTIPIKGKTYYTVLHAKLSPGAEIKADNNGTSATISCWTLSNGYRSWSTSAVSSGHWDTYVARYTISNTATMLNNFNWWLVSPADMTNLTIQVAYCAVYDGTSLASYEDLCDPNKIDGMINEKNAVYTFGTSNATVRALWTIDRWKDYAEEPKIGDGTKANPYQISSAEELAWMSEQTFTGNHLKDKYFIQTKDIDLSGRSWTPIGNHQSNLLDGAITVNFKGHYDGQNYKITGLSLGEKGEEFWRAGLFGFVTEVNEDTPSTLKNIIVYGNAQNTGNVVNGVSQRVGGIVGGLNNSIIENCKNYINVIGKSTSTGGIVGALYGNAKIKDCENYGDIISNSNSTGGIAGSCDMNALVVNSKNYGTIKGGAKNNGGIVGSANNSSIMYCENLGLVTGNDDNGGILGTINSGTVNIENCFNKGKIAGEVSATGGIVGFVNSNTIGNINLCVNEGDIQAGTTGGGIVGTANGGKILNSYASCNITCNNSIFSAGGIIGYSEKTAVVENCFFVGNSTGKVSPIFGGAWTYHASVSSTYAVLNSQRQYTNGDFASFQLMGQTNQGYPVMQGLFNAFEPNGSVVIEFFRSQNFTKIS